MINKPIFIVGVPHSGTSWLGRVLAKHPKVIDRSETNYVWMWGNAWKSNDVLLSDDVTSKIRKHIEHRITQHFRVDSEHRYCDKTPRNCLRIPFIYELFPDAKIIFVIRDGRAVLRSIQRQNVNPTNQVMQKEVLYRLQNVPWEDLYMYLPRVKWIVRRLMGKPLNYWGARPPGWQEWPGRYSHPVVIAKQWAESTRIARQEGNKLPSDNYLEVRYEDLIENPAAGVDQVMRFLELGDYSSVLDYASQSADPERVERWRTSLQEDLISEVKPFIEPVLSELGYAW
ncbi:MAG: sulfotransferase [Cyanobacteria bacterium P01_H01_bin.21]